MYLIIPLLSRLFCHHNEDQQARIDNSRILMEEDNNNLNHSWGNIRILFDTGLLYRDDEQYICKRVGQIVSNRKCEESDIFTSVKRNSLVKTLESVKEFAERTFKVRQIPNNTFIVDRKFGLGQMEVSNVDLYVRISPVINLDEKTVGSAGITKYEYPSKRPTEGGIEINVKAIPTTPILYNTWKNDFFYSCLHELFHLLGFTSSLYTSFHPIDSFTPYSNPLCKITRKGRQFTFLTTPHCHKFALKHFNMEYFEGDNGEKCPSGIELEDSGSYSSKLSHLETRTYMTDLMLASHFSECRFDRFTDATAAVLLDTGNYIINFSNVQPILWGNRESIDGTTYINNFPIDPPQKVFPDLYIHKEEDYYNICGFDYKFFGVMLGLPAPDCNKPAASQVNSNISEEQITKYCQGKEFYNPKNYKTIDSQRIFGDFTEYKAPSITCPEGMATLPYVNRCLKYRFIKDNEIRFDAPNFGFSCYRDSNPHRRRLVYTVNYKCPDFERFKRTVKLYDSFFESDPFVDDEPKYYHNANVDRNTIDYTPVPLSTFQKLIIPLLVTVLIILLINIALYTLYKCGILKCRRKKSKKKKPWEVQISSTDSSADDVKDEKEFVVPMIDDV